MPASGLQQQQDLDAAAAAIIMQQQQLNKQGCTDASISSCSSDISTTPAIKGIPYYPHLFGHRWLPKDFSPGLNAAATDDATRDDEASIRTTVVKFSTLEIREYPLCIGDNPGAASGPPISLDWAWYTGEEGDDEDPGILVLDLEQYESYRGTRRTLQGMCRGERRRTYILQKEWGYTMHQIRAATRPVNITRAQRKKTLNSFNGGLHKLHYFIEKVVRAITGGGRKRKEKELMDSVHAMLGNKQIGDSIRCTNKSSSQTTDSLHKLHYFSEANDLGYSSRSSEINNEQQQQQKAQKTQGRVKTFAKNMIKCLPVIRPILLGFKTRTLRARANNNDLSCDPVSIGKLRTIYRNGGDPLDTFKAYLLSNHLYKFCWDCGVQLERYEEPKHWSEAQTYSVLAPPGKLGIILSPTDAIVLGHKASNSIMKDKISPGGRIIAVDGVDVTYMNTIEVHKLLASKADCPRRLEIMKCRDSNGRLQQMNPMLLWNNNHIPSPNGGYQRTKSRFQQILEDKTIKDSEKVSLVFHGTHPSNIANILQNGLDPARRNGQSLGAGEYFSKDPSVCIPYCKSGNTMLVFLVIDSAATKYCSIEGKRIPSSYVIVQEPRHQFPFGVLHFHVPSQPNVSLTSCWCPNLFWFN